MHFNFKEEFHQSVQYRTMEILILNKIGTSSVYHKITNMNDKMKKKKNVFL